VRVARHALAQQAVGHLVAVQPAGRGLGLRERVGEEETAEALAVQSLALQHDLPTHRQSTEDEPVDVEVVEQCRDVFRERRQRGGAGHDGAAAVPTEVRRDHPPARSHELWSPHRAVERVAVHEDQHVVGDADVVVADGDAVDGCDAHGGDVML
jgi:hypothetical protein